MQLRSCMLSANLVMSTVRDLGVLIDSRLTMADHVTASRSVGETIKKVTNIVYFTYLPRSHRWSDRHQICSGGWFPGRNQLCQISFQSVQGFGFCRGSKFGPSHRNEVSPLTQGLNYRSACDVFLTYCIFGITYMLLIFWYCLQLTIYTYVIIDVHVA